jgi:hypothetical protein
MFTLTNTEIQRNCHKAHRERGYLVKGCTNATDIPLGREYLARQH